MHAKASNPVRLLCMTALFAALIYLFTAYIRIPTHTGYTHIGDGFIYLAASLLPPGYAAFAGALGAALADGLTGYAIWIVPSVIIKSLTALCFTAKAKTVLCKRNFVAILPAFLLCFGGYYLAEVLMTGNLFSPLGGLPGYFIQVGLSTTLYIGVGFALDRTGFKSRMGLIVNKQTA